MTNEIEKLRKEITMLEKHIKYVERTYIKSPSEAPEGANVKRGSHGGLYYDEAPNSEKPNVESQDNSSEDIEEYKGMKVGDKVFDEQSGEEATIRSMNTKQVHLMNDEGKEWSASINDISSKEAPKSSFDETKVKQALLNNSETESVIDNAIKNNQSIDDTMTDLLNKNKALSDFIENPKLTADEIREVSNITRSFIEDEKSKKRFNLRQISDIDINNALNDEKINDIIKSATGKSTVNIVNAILPELDKKLNLIKNATAKDEQAIFAAIKKKVGENGKFEELPKTADEEKAKKKNRIDNTDEYNKAYWDMMASKKAFENVDEKASPELKQFFKKIYDDKLKKMRDEFE